MLELTAVAFTLLGLVGMAVASRQVIWLREACALAVIAINGWNRLNVAFRTPVGDYVSPHSITG